MRDRLTQIGFNQRIRLEWLEQTAAMVLAGMDRAAVKSELQTFLKDKLSVGNDPERGNREKAITILEKIWVSPHSELKSLRDKGLDLLKGSDAERRVAFHWGMAMAAYPFWGLVASTVGRLLRLQGTVSAAQVQRRIREQYGERETVARAARRIIRSFVDWGTLAETPKKGVYRQGRRIVIEDPGLVVWMVEAVLHANRNGSGSLTAVFDSPSIFPFKLHQLSGTRLCALSPTIEIVRHGLDDEMIILKRAGEHASRLRKGR
jgi:hypothetical protein